MLHTLCCTVAAYVSSKGAVATSHTSFGFAHPFSTARVFSNNHSGPGLTALHVCSCIDRLEWCCKGIVRGPTASQAHVPCRYIEEMLGLAHLAAVGRWRRRMAAIGLCTLLCSSFGIPWSKQRIVRVISLGLKAMSEASQFQVRLRAVCDTSHASRPLEVGLLKLRAMSDA